MSTATSLHLGDDFLSRTAPLATLARWGVHEATVHRTVERVEAALIASAQFQMPQKRVFQEAQTVYSFVAVDASEVPCERPKKAGRPYMGAVLLKTAAPLVQRQEKAAYPEVPGAYVYSHAAHLGHRYECRCRA